MHSDRYIRRLAVPLLGIFLGLTAQVVACGLEPGIRGGITVSHSGSLDVALAVAKARGDGLLPQANTGTIPNDVRLRLMIADLQRIQSRLDVDIPANGTPTAASFSLVLVGPGLWSHFHVTSGGVLARYHANGPLDGQTVVLTHHAVIQALLRGDLSALQAAQLGLIAYSGGNTEGVRQLFDAGVSPKV